MTVPRRLRADQPRHRRAIRGLAPGLALVLWAALAGLGCASQSGGSVAAAPPAAPDEEEPAEVKGPPGGGEWLVDEEGRRYYTAEVERRPEYTILPNGRVMLPPGVATELVEVREDTLVVKLYDRESLGAAGPRPERRTRAEAVADLAALETTTVDRLRFEPFGRGLPNRGQWRQTFELVDMNGDGHLDIVHGPARKGDGLPRIFLGDGAGGWRWWREVRFESRPLDYGSIAVADFDLDGHLDLALAIHLRGLTVLKGDGNGVFREWGEGLPYWVPGGDQQPPAYSSRTVEVVDWNRDGRPDLLTLGEGPRMLREPGSAGPGVSHGDRGPILFLNRADGRWERYDQGTGRGKIFGDGLALGDFDGDGLTDFVVASSVSGASQLVKLGREDGTWEDVSLGDLVRRGAYRAVHAADLDGDGRDEILLGYLTPGADDSRWSGIDLVEYEEGGWRRRAVAAEVEDLGGITALGSGDLNGDQRLDIVALTGVGERWVLLGAEDGSFVREESDELAPADVRCRGYEVEVVDLGDDAGPFVVMGFAGEPGSEQLFAGMEVSCQSRGSLEAWRPTR
jgi:hypothetical protein